MKTTLVQNDEATRKWYVVDAAGKPAGRLAVKIAYLLRGKNEPTFAPHTDTGHFVVVINAEKVKLSGNKEENKIYKHYTGYSNGLREYSAAVVRSKHPERIITQAVKGMLPKNRLSRTHMTRLKVYAGEEHPHKAQQPESIELL